MLTDDQLERGFVIGDWDVLPSQGILRSGDDIERPETRFVAVRRELEELVAVEHDKVLQLICFTSPVPDEWQPMPEAVERVEERRS